MESDDGEASRGGACGERGQASLVRGLFVEEQDGHRRLTATQGADGVVAVLLVTGVLQKGVFGCVKCLVWAVGEDPGGAEAVAAG